jgi:hypothetical protein
MASARHAIGMACHRHGMPSACHGMGAWHAIGMACHGMGRNEERTDCFNKGIGPSNLLDRLG